MSAGNPDALPITVQHDGRTYLRLDVHHSAMRGLCAKMVGLLDHYREAVARIRDRAAFVTRAVDELEAYESTWTKDAGK